MYLSRVVQHIIRRVSSGDSLLTQLNPTPLQVGTSSKLLEYDNIAQTKRPLLSLTNSYQIRTMASEPNEPSTSQHTTNRLALEKSPYLLQHATNVVDWYPWCEEAFEKARKENKLIFLSVGYSTCHWCHVMEKESFENDSVAEIMNRHYISIKVDREERPDIDRVYMSFIQATSGSGGWPMSVFLTPNLEPITGGTYFPPEDKWGRPGFKTILNNIAEKWENEKSSIIESGKNILAILKRASEKDFSGTGECAPPGLECIQRCLQQFCKSYEHEYGGFSDSPKFPQPSNFDFLFHVYSRDSESVTGKQCLNMCLHTLKCMANGGIHDHVSNGFARYSTDSRWHVPHFEKMLYDQGQLAVSYCNAYVATKDPFYADIVRDILLYVSRDLSHEDGGFYSAEDADSFPAEGATHKREGAFCVWEYDEIIQHVQGRTGGVANAEIFCYHFNVKKAGNVHPSQDPHNELEKKNVLICYGSIESTAGYFEMTVEDIRDSIDKSLKMLYDVRQKRPRPHLDSKMLTAWNGLMISGFARAGYYLKDDAYISRAIKAAEFIRKYLYQETDKSLIRCCYRASDGQVVQNAVPIVGFLDDYTFLIRGLLDLYEATLDASWLEWAEILQDTQDRMFWDETNSGYFTSPEGDASVLIRVKEDQDGAEPSGNSVSAQNLIRLGAYLERGDMKIKAEKLLASFSDRLQKIPIALPEMTSALMLYHDSPTQVFIVGQRDDPGTEALLDVLRSRLMPGRLLVLADGPEGQSAALYNRLDVLSKLKCQGNRPTAYICHHHSCSLPVTESQELCSLLEEDLRVQQRQ